MGLDFRAARQSSRRCRRPLRRPRAIYTALTTCCRIRAGRAEPEDLASAMRQVSHVVTRQQHCVPGRPNLSDRGGGSTQREREIREPAGGNTNGDGRISCMEQTPKFHQEEHLPEARRDEPDPGESLGAHPRARAPARGGNAGQGTGRLGATRYRDKLDHETDDRSQLFIFSDVCDRI